jgi:hypothetical protein
MAGFFGEKASVSFFNNHTTMMATGFLGGGFHPKKYHGGNQRWPSLDCHRKISNKK